MVMRPLTYKWVTPKPIQFIHVTDPVLDMDCGWRIETIEPELELDHRHATVHVNGHLDASHRHVFAFNLVKTSETPVLNGTALSDAIFAALDKVLEQIAEETPFYGESDFEMPRCQYIVYWDEGLPGELLPLRGAVYHRLREDQLPPT
jgi:hypothetical protein